MGTLLPAPTTTWLKHLEGSLDNWEQHPPLHQLSVPELASSLCQFCCARRPGGGVNWSELWVRQSPPPALNRSFRMVLISSGASSDGNSRWHKVHFSLWCQDGVERPGSGGISPQGRDRKSLSGVFFPLSCILFPEPVFASGEPSWIKQNAHLVHIPASLSTQDHKMVWEHTRPQDACIL